MLRAEKRIARLKRFSSRKPTARLRVVFASTSGVTERESKLAWFWRELPHTCGFILGFCSFALLAMLARIVFLLILGVYPNL